MGTDSTHFPLIMPENCLGVGTVVDAYLCEPGDEFLCKVHEAIEDPKTKEMERVILEEIVTFIIKQRTVAERFMMRAKSMAPVMKIIERYVDNGGHHGMCAELKKVW